MSAPPRHNAGVPSKAKMPELARPVHGGDRVGLPFATHVDGVDAASRDHHGHVGRGRECSRRRLAAQRTRPSEPDGVTVTPPAAGAKATQPTAAPSPSASRQSLVAASARASSAAEGPERQDGREEGCGHEAAPDLLAEHRHLHRAQSQPALVGGHLDGEPSLVRHRCPHSGVVAVRRVRRGGPGSGRPRHRARRCRITGAGQRSHDRPGPHPRPERIVSGHPIEQSGRGGAQRLLIGRQVEVHGGAV